MFKNWRCNNYKVEHEKGNYSYQDLKKYFAIDGTEKVECIENFGLYAAGTTYRVRETYNGFMIY